MKRKGIIILVILVLVSAGFFGYRYMSGRDSSGDKQLPDGQGKADSQIFSTSINGSRTSEEKSGLRTVAVVIDNSPEARPQSGLASSEVVYETLAEGGTTRYLALFQSKDAAKIGPVRSARSYFALLASDWQALFAHVGGSSEALAEISQGTYPGLLDLNQFYKDSFFERAKNEAAPHNVYTSTSKLYDFLGASVKSSSQRRTLFTFKDDESPLAQSNGKNIVLIPAYTVVIDFSLPAFKASYVYDATKNIYRRSIGGKADMDALTKEQIQAKTIVIQYANIVPVPKDKLARVTIDMVGSGNALIFMDGKSLEAKWKKTRYGRTIFTDYDGKELSINRGPIWVEIVPAGKEKVVTFDGALVNPDGTVNTEETTKLK